MGKIRRGGFILVTWKGDHSPYHVHVWQACPQMGPGERGSDEGQGHEPDPQADLRATPGGAAVKINDVRANNRKKAFEIQTESKTLIFPYVLLRQRPNPKNRIVEAFPDPDLGMEGFTYRLADGTGDTVHIDAVLEYNQDPDYLNELLLHRLTLEAQKAVEVSSLSKRELIRRLGTSASQFYRLLDPANSKKSVGQMLALLHLVGQDVEVVISPRAKRPQTPRGRARRGGKAAV
jgi:hypothetical protein